jgi:hypothetical protein
MRVYGQFTGVLHPGRMARAQSKRSHIMKRIECITPAGMTMICLVLAAGCSQTVDLNQVSPPAAEAVKKAFPAASITKITLESGGPPKSYEVGLDQGEQVMEVTVSDDGFIIEAETVMALGEVPAPVREAVTKAVGDGKLFKLERVEHRGRLRDGKFVAIDPPEVFYEAKYMRSLIMHEVEWAPDGSAR